MTTDIKQRIKERFARPLGDFAERRIVIWHDTEGEFESLFQEMGSEQGFCSVEADANPDDLPAGGTCCLEIRDGNTFQTKRLVCRLAANRDFLLYRKRSARQLDGDWFADVEMYAEHFQADYVSLLIEQLHAADSQEVRDAVRRMRPFFAAQNRVSKFCSFIPAPQSRADIVRGALAVTFGASAADSSAIVRSYLTASIEDDQASASFATLMEKYCLVDGFGDFLAGAFGYVDDPFDSFALGTHVLLTALSATMSKEALIGLEARISPAHAQHCLAVARDWAASDSDRALLYDLCLRVQAELRLSTRFEQIDADKLFESDVFPAIDEVLLKDLMESLSQGADRRDEAKTAIRMRTDTCWISIMQPYYDCLDAACALEDFRRAHAAGFHIARAKEVWGEYVRGWWKMDAAYRKFCNAYRACVQEGNEALDDVVRSLAAWADRLYANWFLDESNACWIHAVADDLGEHGYASGVPRLREFYDTVVCGELSSSKRVMVVVSDAMRFEVAQQLAQTLERETRGNADVSALQAQFPSITKFGMAALLPNYRFQYDAASDQVCVDNLFTVGIPARQEALQARRPASAAIQYNDLMDMSRAEKKDFASALELIYVYHNTIDAAGHGETSGQDIFDACDDAIRDVVALIKAATSAMGISHVVITSDHGFLYTRMDIPETEQASRSEVHGTIQQLDRRFIRASADTASDVFLPVNMSDVDGGASTWWAPRNCVRIKASGSKSYVHGGVSLQELCVPVVRFHNASSGSKSFVEKQYAQIQLLDPVRRITSMIAHVELYQKEAVGGKVLTGEYELVLTDPVGNAVSDVSKVVAQNESAVDADRKIRVRLTLKPNTKWDSSATYCLVAKNVQTGEVCWQEPYTVSIAFSPMDFGF